MELIISIILLLLLSYIFIFLGKKIKIPGLVSLMIVGLVVNIPAIKVLLVGKNLEPLLLLGDIGLISLMFITGLKSSQKAMIKETKDSVFIALSAALLSLLLGFVTFMLLGFSFLISLLVGICLSVTAEATTAEVLLETKKMNTRVGTAMIGSGVVDDMVGFGLFAIATYFLKESYIKEDLLLASVIFFFFLGIYLSKRIKPKFKNKAEKAFSLTFVPFFFISIGIHIDYHVLVLSPLLILLIIAVGITGKMSGTFAVKKSTKFNWKKLHLIGWAMNSRGGVGLAFALIAYRTKLIPAEIYSSLIIFSLLSALAFPFILKYFIKKDKNIMN